VQDLDAKVGKTKEV